MTTSRNNRGVSFRDESDAESPSAFTIIDNESSVLSGQARRSSATPTGILRQYRGVFTGYPSAADAGEALDIGGTGFINWTMDDDPVPGPYIYDLAGNYHLTGSIFNDVSILTRSTASYWQSPMVFVIPYIPGVRDTYSAYLNSWSRADSLNNIVGYPTIYTSEFKNSDDRFRDSFSNVARNDYHLVAIWRTYHERWPVETAGGHSSWVIGAFPDAIGKSFWGFGYDSGSTGIKVLSQFNLAVSTIIRTGSLPGFKEDWEVAGVATHISASDLYPKDLSPTFRARFFRDASVVNYCSYETSNADALTGGFIMLGGSDGTANDIYTSAISHALLFTTASIPDSVFEVTSSSEIDQLAVEKITLGEALAYYRGTASFPVQVEDRSYRHPMVAYGNPLTASIERETVGLAERTFRRFDGTQALLTAVHPTSDLYHSFASGSVTLTMMVNVSSSVGEDESILFCAGGIRSGSNQSAHAPLNSDWANLLASKIFQVGVSQVSGTVRLYRKAVAQSGTSFFRQYTMVDTPIQQDSWHTVTVRQTYTEGTSDRFARNSGSVWFYVDGLLIASASNVMIPNTRVQMLSIGADVVSTAGLAGGGSTGGISNLYRMLAMSNYFKGKIGDVRIFTGSLSDEQIMNLHTSLMNGTA